MVLDTTYYFTKDNQKDMTTTNGNIEIVFDNPIIARRLRINVLEEMNGYQCDMIFM